MGEPDQRVGSHTIPAARVGGWDEDPLSLVPSKQLVRRFQLWVHVLLVAGGAWLAWSAFGYWRQGGWSLHANGFKQLVLAVVLFAVLLALAVTRPLAKAAPGRIRLRFAIVSTFAALLSLAGLLLACKMVYDESSRRNFLGTPIVRDAEATRYLVDHLPDGGAAYMRVPTGVYVQSVEFKGTSNVAVSGYVWQRIPDGLQTEPGVVFPEAADAYLDADMKVYEKRQGDHTLMGWYFNLELRQLFDYRAYPLDKQNVWLRLWPTTFNETVVLTPDFAAYPPWDPGDMTAMDGQLVYGEWNPDVTGYSYVNNDYSSSFGYTEAAGISGSSTPELYFNVGLKRDPMGPLFGQLIRWLFIALIVFAALFLITIDEQRREVVGFTTFEVISFAVGMLLVIVFDQNAVREATGARGIVYLEYFSYALYAMILLVGLNAMLITAKVRVPALIWGGNLLPKLLYWPGYFGIVLLATLLTFF